MEGDLHKCRLHNVEGLDSMRERGRGSYGAVYELSVNRVPCIGKRLHNILVGRGNEIYVNDEEKRSIVAKFKKECSTLSGLRHPNIVQFIGVYYEDGREDDIFLLMEHLHMDLETCINKYSTSLSLPYRLRILRDVAYGLSYLHSQSIIHRDLNQGNVLLTESLTAKIADLGASKVIGYSTQLTAMSTVPGALGYMPPEAMLSPAIYNTQLDCFSYGHLALYLLLGKYPHLIDSHITAADVEAKTLQLAKRSGSMKALGPTHVMYGIIRSCLMDEPSSRPTSKELVSQMVKLCDLNFIPYTNIMDYVEALNNLRQTLKEGHQVSQYHNDTPTTTNSSMVTDQRADTGNTQYMALQPATISESSTDTYTPIIDNTTSSQLSSNNDTYLALVNDQKPNDEHDLNPKSPPSVLHDDTPTPPPRLSEGSRFSSSNLAVAPPMRSMSPLPMTSSPQPPLPPRPMSASPIDRPSPYDYVHPSGRGFSLNRDGNHPVCPISPLRSTGSNQQSTDLFQQFDSDDDEGTESTHTKDTPTNQTQSACTFKKRLSEGTYIFGGLSREVGEALCCNTGDFLVRTSMTTGGKVLTVKRNEGQYGHLTIHQTQNKSAYFFNDGELFDSVTDLIVDLATSPADSNPIQRIVLLNPVTTKERKIIKPSEFTCSRNIIQRRQYTLTNARVYSSNEEVVMKMFTVNQPQVLKEGYYLSQLNHPNVVRMIGMCVDKPICVLLEKNVRNSLLDHLQLQKDTPQLQSVVNGLLEGLSYLHANGIIHRNIAARNCIVTSDCTVVKLANFQRCARVTKDKPIVTDYTNFAIGWASPEVLNSGEYSESSDVWSFGILMWEVFNNGREPYSGLSKTQILDKITSQSMIQLPSQVPTNYQEMFNKCLSHRPTDRPRLSQLQYLYIKSNSKSVDEEYI